MEIDFLARAKQSVESRGDVGRGIIGRRKIEIGISRGGSSARTKETPLRVTASVIIRKMEFRGDVC